jgi:hypothetical protein
MNLDIDKKLHRQYVQNKHLHHNQTLIMDELDILNKNPSPSGNVVLQGLGSQ